MWAAVLFGAPFLLLAGVYPALPTEFPVMQTVAGVLVAAKSPFIVFRVPFMNLTHGAMALVMLRHSRDFREPAAQASYAAFFSTLLFAVAFKSDVEGVELARTALLLRIPESWFVTGTAASVIGGVALAFFRARHSRIPWRELRLAAWDTVQLSALLAVYLVTVGLSLLLAHRPAA